jgi:peptidoglycan/LPS O-acetylase OafA/YrhL
MLQQFFAIPNILESYWTLQIEIIFYAICVGLFMLGMLERYDKIFVMTTIFLGLAVVLGAVRFATHAKVPVAVPLGLSIMFWGSLLRAGSIEQDVAARWYANVLMIILVAVTPVVSFLAYNFDSGFQETWYRYTLSYLAAIAVIYLLTGRFRLGGRVFSWLGTISYSVYLFHPIFVSLTLLYIFPFWNGRGPVHMYIAIAGMMSLAFSHVVYRLLEEPSIRLGRALGGYLSGMGLVSAK